MQPALLYKMQIGRVLENNYELYSNKPIRAVSDNQRYNLLRISMSLKLNPLSFVFALFITFLASCTNLPDQMVDKTGAKMALVPAGEFEMTLWDEMKNERNLRSVHVEDFYMDVYEVTNQRYTECVQGDGCAEPANTMEYSDEAYLDHPVVFVTWDMADSYCQWRQARLPTKAEWEKAAADELETVEYYWGDESPLCQVGSRMGAGIDENTDYDPGTEPVGTSSPNAFGLYEMTGGMWEWVQDKHELAAYTSSPDFVSFLRVYRTGGYGPLYNRFVCSFRCARSP